MKYKLTLIILSLLLASCATTPPRDVNNICRVFSQYPKWYWDAQDVERRWLVPVPVQMAIIHQESKFDGSAQPPRTKLLWVIPWTRPSTAYGYTQALYTTWQQYKKSQNGGSFWASRDVFSDAVDFVGWYANETYKRTRIPRNDAYNLYLAYHEGIGGYQRKSYEAKPWLMGVARKVKARSQLFEAQLNQCRGALSSKPWYR